MFPWIKEDRKKEEFVQEQLQLELPLIPPDYKIEKEKEEEVERGVIVIDLF